MPRSLPVDNRETEREEIQQLQTTDNRRAEFKQFRPPRHPRGRWMRVRFLTCLGRIGEMSKLR